MYYYGKFNKSTLQVPLDKIVTPVTKPELTVSIPSSSNVSPISVHRVAKSQGGSIIIGQPDF